MQARALYAAFDVYPRPKGSSSHIASMIAALARDFAPVCVLCLGDAELPPHEINGGVEIHRLPGMHAQVLQRATAFAQFVEFHAGRHAATLKLIVYRDPWGGLGHLNRALAVCLRLRDEGVDARIVTNSPLAEGLAALARCPMVRLEGSRWAETARAYVAETQPRAVITDTFPYGLREEWRAAPPGPPFIHIAGRLLTPFSMSPEDFSLILQAEPLSERHRTSLGASIALPGPILLPPDRIATPIPAALDRDDLTLIVHSGPIEEVAALTELAEPPYVVPSPLRRSA